MRKKKEIPEAFGTLLKKLRKRQKLTMKQLGTQLDVSESFISRLESGQRQPARELIMQMGPILFPEGNRSGLDELLVSAHFSPEHAEKRVGFQEAQTTLQEELLRNPQNFRALVALIVSLIKQGKYAQAEKRIKAGLKTFDDQVQWQTLMASMELSKGRYETARIFQKEALDYFDPKQSQKLNLNLADLHLNAGVIDFIQGFHVIDAYIEAEDAAKKDTHYTEAHGLLTQALAHFELGLSESPNDIYILDEKARVLFNLNYLQELKGLETHYSETIEAFEKVIYSPQKHRLSYDDLLESSLFLAHTYNKEKQFKMAFHSLNYLETCLPNYWLVHYIKACYHSMKFEIDGQDEDLKLGLKSLERAMQIQDKNNATRLEALSDPDLDALRNANQDAFDKILNTGAKR